MRKNSDSYTTSKAQNHEWPKTVPYRTEREPEWRAQDWAYRYSPSHPKSPSSTSRSSIYGTVQTSPFSVTAHDLNQLHTHSSWKMKKNKNWNWKLKIENEKPKMSKRCEWFEGREKKLNEIWEVTDGFGFGFWCWACDSSSSSSSSRLYV